MRYGDHIEAFRDAIVDAFSSRQALAQFAKATGQVKSLAASVGDGPLEDMAYDFLEVVKARNGEAGLATVMDTALVRRPGNDSLLALARKLGADRPASAADLLHIRALDLRPLEEVWRKALAIPRKRLVVLMLCGAEQTVIGNVIERLRLHLGVPASTSNSRLRLDERFTPVDKTLDLIVRLKPRLAQEHVVCMVDADSAPDDAVARLLPGLFAAYADALAHHLVLLLNTRADCTAPERCILLPAPRFQDTDLYEWVEDVTRDKGWPPDLRDDFKLWLHKAVDEAVFPPTDVAYFALENAIRLLSQNLPQAALRERFRQPP
ncbi:effector-associated domain EAD1-containing protein [Variovorax sp. KK3]|uniref:effector-associated domain EAD1-containing protein n=1 Tax=Variovorax sp. KK3 TaxID=1855728 RepID=UPI00097BDD8C|nr:effector-associated domain EAD1-containing protein [Variovorax sp. KK3]